MVDQVPDGLDALLLAGPGIGPATDFLAALTSLVFAVVFAFLARKKSDRACGFALAGSCLAAILLSLFNAFAWWGTPLPWVRFAGILVGLAAGVASLTRLPRWLATPSFRETEALVEEKDRAVDRLREHETHLGRLVEEVKDYAIFELDLEGRVVSWNLGAERTLGWRAGDIQGLSHAVFYPEEEIRAARPDQDLAQARAVGNLHRDAWRVRKDGSMYRASLALSATHDPKGREAGFLAIIRDISERLAAEAHMQALARDLERQVEVRTAALQESEARLQGFLQHAPAAISFKDLKGHLLLANRRAMDLLGRSLTEASDSPLGPPLSEDLVREIRQQDAWVLAHRQELQAEMTFTMTNGSSRDFLVHKFPLFDPTGRFWGLGVFAIDITERKLLEQAHIQHQKSESARLLAGGLAHDFNNLLGAMLGNLELAQALADPHSPVTGHLVAQEELVGRASSLVAQFLAYAGQGKLLVRILDLNREVDAMARVLRASLAPKVSLCWEPGQGLPPMEGDLGQLQSVIMSLVLNASEAMSVQDGVVTLRTEARNLDQADLDRQFPGQGLAPGAYLVLEVADNGPGMPPDVRARVFEPFFSTKFAGRGMGLAAVQGILRGHRGAIQVSSQEGKGTSFHLFFPAAKTPVPSISSAPPPAAPPLAELERTGTALVVDDEDALRVVLRRGMELMGFAVLEARNGLEALQVFEANRERIILVLMDLTMPRMDGEEAYHLLRRTGAMAPFILCSGFGQEEALRRFHGCGLAGFLQKPFGLHALGDAVRRALAGPPDTRAQELVWLPEWETGHAVLDDQHRELVQAFNDLVAAAHSHPGKDPPVKALDRLVSLAITHFATEESLMTQTGYAGAKEHQAVHALLTRQARDLAERIRRRETDLTPQVLDFLEEWLVCHMRREDAGLARHLKGEGH